jgi:uncharacterized protein YpbB
MISTTYCLICDAKLKYYSSASKYCNSKEDFWHQYQIRISADGKIESIKLLKVNDYAVEINLKDVHFINDKYNEIFKDLNINDFINLSKTPFLNKINNLKSLIAFL